MEKDTTKEVEEIAEHIVHELCTKLEYCDICDDGDSYASIIDISKEAKKILIKKLTTLHQKHATELEKAVEAERQKYRKEIPATFGDIYTNGINYWMVVGGFNGREHLRPVVLIDGMVSHFVGHYDGTVSNIKPHAIYYGNIHALTPTKTDKQ